MKVSEFNQTMAYLLKPKPKMQVAELDSELEKVLQELNEKFGPGTIQEGTQGIPTPPKTIERDMFREAFKADGGTVRQNFAAAGLALPVLSYPVSYGLATLFGLSTAGGAKVLGDRVTDHIKNNPEILNDPRFKAAALSFGINVPGYIAPDADEMEREAEKLREMTKSVGSPVEPPKIDTTTGETKPLEIEKQKPPVSGTIDIPSTTGGSEIPEQLPTIFESRKVENIKKTFDKVDKEYIERDKGYADRIDNLYSEDFAKQVKNLIDDDYGGNVQRLAGDLGIERVRINTLLKKHKIKLDRAGNQTIQNIFLNQDKDKLSIPKLTDNIKGNETYLINRAKERFDNYTKEKNTFKNFKDIAEIVGVNLPDKGEQDFFQSKLRSAKKRVGIETKKGFGREVLYNLNDAIKALTKANLAKPVAGTGRVHDKLRTKFERDKDKVGYNTRAEVLRIVRNAQNKAFGGDAVLRAAEQYGHAEAIANQQKYPKLFKDSNAADISTFVFQDPILNVDVLQAYGSIKTGIEQKRQPFLKKLESLVGKKATAENIQIANEGLNSLNELNDLARIQIKRFQRTNRFVRDQENRIPDFELTLPKVGETFKSGFLNVDMSSIDPSVSVGRILEINPDAKTFNDLNKQEQELYKENLKNQMIDYLSFFYKEYGADKDDIDDLADAISEAKIRTRVKKSLGGMVLDDIGMQEYTEDYMI
tara:strand:- start:1 stop:2112 length:2112 start_codon:yes stop_codon:yes gene_type:complete